MPKFETRRRVSHSPQDMFALVADVERYPEFVPLCESLRVRERTTDAEGRTVLAADMTVAYKLLRETFTSRVTLDPAQLAIFVAYLDGPFSTMDNRWRFHPLPDNGCEVHFYIAYEFRSRMLGLVMGSVFDLAFRRFADAFERRADALYGRGRARA